MKKNNFILYVLSAIMLIFVIIFKRVLYDFIPRYSSLINVLFWLLLMGFCIIKFGFSRDKNYLKHSAVQIVIIGVLSYFIITYGLGMFTGFGRNVFNIEPFGILRNIFAPAIIIVCQEIIRYIFAKKCQKVIKPYIFLTIIYIFLNIIMELNNYSFTNMEIMFKFVCLLVFPSIARESLYSYITYKISLTPSLILRLAFELYIYIFPILPDLGNYLMSLSAIVYPAIIYMLINKNIKNYDKNSKYIISVRRTYIFAPIIVILSIIVILVSGIFNYQLIAIGSGSMEPVYYRGDAVIFHKIKDLDKITEGTIIAYKKDEILVTHRVVEIFKTKKGYAFKTKGDNNDTVDNYTVLGENVVGIVVYRISYIGYPTIWINEQFKKL